MKTYKSSIGLKIRDINQSIWQSIHKLIGNGSQWQMKKRVVHSATTSVVILPLGEPKQTIFKFNMMTLMLVPVHPFHTRRTPVFLTGAAELIGVSWQSVEILQTVALLCSLPMRPAILRAWPAFSTRIDWFVEAHSTHWWNRNSEQGSCWGQTVVVLVKLELRFLIQWHISNLFVIHKQCPYITNKRNM